MKTLVSFPLYLILCIYTQYLSPNKIGQCCNCFITYHQQTSILLGLTEKMTHRKLIRNKRTKSTCIGVCNGWHAREGKKWKNLKAEQKCSKGDKAISRIHQNHYFKK